MVPENAGELGMVAVKALRCVHSYYPGGVDLRLMETLLPHVQLLISYDYNTETSKLLLAYMLYELAC
jgi:hypothetical protein